MGILQARTLERVAMPFSRGSSQPRDQTQVSHIAGGLSLPSEPPGKPKNTGEGSLCLLQGIFLAQESNRGLLRGRWILYQLSHQRSPGKITSSGLTHRGDNSFLLSPNRVISGCLAAHKVVKYHQGSRSHHPAVLPSSEDWVSPSSSAHPFPLPRRLQWLQASPLQRIRF